MADSRMNQASKISIFRYLNSLLLLANPKARSMLICELEMKESAESAIPDSLMDSNDC